MATRLYVASWGCLVIAHMKIDKPIFFLIWLSGSIILAILDLYSSRE